MCYNRSCIPIRSSLLETSRTLPSHAPHIPIHSDLPEALRPLPSQASQYKMHAASADLPPLPSARRLCLPNAPRPATLARRPVPRAALPQALQPPRAAPLLPPLLPHASHPRAPCHPRPLTHVRRPLPGAASTLLLLSPETPHVATGVALLHSISCNSDPRVTDRSPPATQAALRATTSQPRRPALRAAGARSVTQLLPP